jgi:serine/threonine protein kinase
MSFNEAIYVNDEVHFYVEPFNSKVAFQTYQGVGYTKGVKLGEGGFGDVYKSKLQGEDVAVKWIKHPELNPESEYSRTEDSKQFMQRVCKEAIDQSGLTHKEDYILKFLNYMQNIPPPYRVSFIFEVHIFDTCFFYVRF